MIAFLVAQAPAKNPSALLTSKIKSFRRDPHRLRLEYFSMRLDPKCLEQLLQLPPPVQEDILMDTNVEKARNLSAMVWVKIKDRRASGGFGGVPSPMSPMFLP